MVLRSITRVKSLNLYLRFQIIPYLLCRIRLIATGPTPSPLIIKEP